MSAGLQPFSIVGRRYSAGSSHRFSPFFSDRFERRGLVYVGADYSNLSIHDESYQYDLNGNRELVTNANGDLVVYSTGTNNELTSDGAFTYAYDAEGNRISKTNAAGTERELYVWDYRNRLSSVTKQEYNTTTQEWETVQIVEYAYDYNNVLIRKVLDANGDGVSDSKTIFLPENYQTAIQLDDADLSDSTYETVSHRYLWTPGQQDKLLADVTPTETLWTLTDHLGTIRDIIQNTPSGLVVPAHIIYDAYGNVLSCKDANGTDIETPVIFGFTGKYFDADTQLQNNVNRWYDATTGRWLSTDPIGFNGNDTNLYRYVGNISIAKLDFWGMCDCVPCNCVPKKQDCREILKQIDETLTQMAIYVTNGKNHTLKEATQAASSWATVTGYRSDELKKQPCFFQKAVEDVENSEILTISSGIVWIGNYVSDWWFGRPPINTGHGDKWILMEMYRLELLKKRIKVLCKNAQ